MSGVSDQKFNCPHCGAPGETQHGNAIYSCICRFNHQQFSPPPPGLMPFSPWPNYPYYPSCPPYYVTCGPNVSNQGGSTS